MPAPCLESKRQAARCKPVLSCVASRHLTSTFIISALRHLPLCRCSCQDDGQFLKCAHQRHQGGASPAIKEGRAESDEGQGALDIGRWLVVAQLVHAGSAGERDQHKGGFGGGALLPEGVTVEMIAAARGMQMANSRAGARARALRNATFLSERGKAGASASRCLDASPAALPVHHTGCAPAQTASLRAHCQTGGMYSAEALEGCVAEIPGVGRFTAYRDGRVRCIFADRCLAELDGRGERCEMILPDGEEMVVVVSGGERHSYGLEHYISLLVQFSEWAFRTEVERYEAAAQEADKQAAIQHELLKIRRSLAQGASLT